MKRASYVYTKNHPLGVFFIYLSIVYYISLITSYLRSRFPKNANPMIFFTQAVLSLIAVSFNVAPEPTKSSIKRTVWWSICSLLIKIVFFAFCILSSGLFKDFCGMRILLGEYFTRGIRGIEGSRSWSTRSKIYTLREMLGGVSPIASISKVVNRHSRLR